jgi:poly-beta-1,6-N-acetyl-D-glucosamine biosynthesis protein PgaD
MSPTTDAWPPLLTGARRPRWVAIRDVFLTLVAWFLLAWLLRDLLYLAYDFFRHPVFELSTAARPDLGVLWTRLRAFVMMSAALILWLALWAVIGRRRLMATGRSRQPASLTIGEEAGRAGIDEKALSEARRFKVTKVLFRADGTIGAFEEASRGGAAQR